jgi:hypothetical protein
LAVTIGPQASPASLIHFYPFPPKALLGKNIDTENTFKQPVLLANAMSFTAWFLSLQVLPISA